MLHPYLGLRSTFAILNDNLLRSITPWILALFIDQIIALFFDEYLGAEPAEEGFTLEIEYYLERNATKHVVCDRYSYNVVAFVSAVQTFRRRSIILVTHPWLLSTLTEPPWIEFAPGDLRNSRLKERKPSEYDPVTFAYQRAKQSILATLLSDLECLSTRTSNK
ncbi:9900_t:CDS:2 [Paraglomus brasilianum]|uniref:9900_t:CDS:1 n=1 Tax=Paraglomus brasilianum TaxID=144538 RepID=A0A9N9B583_9GLOM|nr:9900_t:CDS:2 [Paraglomus brasilianum]